MTLTPPKPDHYQLAQQLLDECLVETRRTAMLRSEITTLSLLGRLHLTLGSPEA
jgi:hypothetical protein